MVCTQIINNLLWLLWFSIAPLINSQLVGKKSTLEDTTDTRDGLKMGQIARKKCVFFDGECVVNNGFINIISVVT